MKRLLLGFGLAAGAAVRQVVLTESPDQAIDVLRVPLVKALQAELGEERANAIVRKALADRYRKYGEKWWRSQGLGR